MSNTAPAAGTRLRCDACGTEIVVVKPASDPLTCCDRPMSSFTGETSGDAQPAR